MARKSGPEKKAEKGKTARKAAQPVTSEAALRFIRRMQKAFPKRPRTTAEKARLQKYLSKFTDGLLKAVGLSVQSDLMLRPPRTIRPKDFEKTKPDGYGSASRRGGGDRKR